MGVLKSLRVMDKFFHSQFCQHSEVAPHITLYVLNNQATRDEVVALR